MVLEVWVGKFVVLILSTEGNEKIFINIKLIKNKCMYCLVISKFDKFNCA